MRALRFRDQNLTLTEVDIPEPSANEVLLRVRRAGICSTDLEIAKGYMDFSGTLGHEFVGEIADGDEAGTRVVAEINVGCGVCERCQRGLARHCATRTVLGILNKDGCFADYVTMPRANLHYVPDQLEDDLAVFVEPLAAAFEILEQVSVEPTDRVAVLGDGKLGSLVALVLCETSASVTAVGRHPSKLRHLSDRGVATALPDAVVGREFDLVVEATGNPSGFELARSLLRPRGTLVLKSTYHGRLELDAAPLVIDEITVVGSRCGPFEPAVRALAEGRIDPSFLVEESYPLSEGLLAFERASRKGATKVLLTNDA